MAGLSQSNVVALQLEKVRTKIPMAFDLDEKNSFYPKIEKKQVEVVSRRDMRAPIHLRPGGDFAAANLAGGDLGRGTGPQFDKAVISTVDSRIAFEWTFEADWATDDGRKAVLKAFKKVLADAIKEFRRHVDAQVISGGGNGVIGTVSAISTAGGVDTITCNSDGYGIRLMRFNQNLDIYDSTLATCRTTGVDRRITFYDVNNKQIKLPATTGITVGDKLVVKGFGGAASPTWFQGIEYHHSNASTGTWLGFDRSTTPEIRSNRVNAAGDDLQLAYPRLAMNMIADRVGEDMVPKVEAWMHRCQRNAYEEIGQLVSVINKTAKEEDLDLYFGDNMQMGGAPVHVHQSWNKKRIDFVNMPGWGRAVMREADFYRDHNNNQFFVVRGPSGGIMTAEDTYVLASFQTWIDNPAETAYIDNLAVLAGY